jgi:plasmid stability protein
MPNLSIKDVPEAVAEALRRRAARNHRSLQGELLRLVTLAALDEEAAGAADPLAMAAPGEPPEGHKTLERIVAEHRTRGARVVRGAPRGTEVARADRDRRGAAR